MASITLQGTPCNTCGVLPALGTQAPDFTLTGADLSERSKKDFASGPIVLNIFPSVDTPVCAASVRRFNEAAATLKNSTILCVSMDLPFALGRFCGAEGIANTVALSAFRSDSFGRDYGLLITDGPLVGLLARAVVIIDAGNTVIHAQLVPEITEEPNYTAAIHALQR